MRRLRGWGRRGRGRGFCEMMIYERNDGGQVGASIVGEVNEVVLSDEIEES